MTENKGDLISREALKETIIKICGKCSNNITDYDENKVPNGNCAIWHILNMIDNAPTVELFCSYLSDGEVIQPCVEAPCKHERPQGEWIKMSDRYGKYFACNNCGYDREKGITNFCPNCGASMVRGENDG